jgi:adenylate cyclase
MSFVTTTLPPDHDEFRTNPDDSAPTEASVDRLFRKSEIEAEYTIGWVRIAAGFILFAGGLGVSSGIASQSMAEGVYVTALITVGAFLLLGITSLLLVVRGWFKPSMAFVFVTGDAIILATSLFFGLKASGLRGNGIAAMPVIWAIPVVLAVGALRYRPAVQLWFTAVMIAGLVGVAVALGFRPFPADLDAAPALGGVDRGVNRLFSLQPYLMRGVMLALVGVTTALVMFRSRRLLVRAVNETARRANLARFLPPEIAPLVAGNNAFSWRQGRRQQATILFVDIRGSTAFAENMDPANLSVFISSFRRRVMRAAEAYGGVVDKFIGDGALVIFGVPEPRADDPGRALACARRLLALVDQWNIKRRFDPPIRVGIGLHTGEVYCGLVGDERRIEFTVLGDAVNVAAKIEQATKRFDAPLLASEAVVTLAGQRNAWREVSREPVGGRRSLLAILAPLPEAPWSPPLTPKRKSEPV